MADAGAARRLGWIGAGAIGLPMLARLIRAGHPVVVFDLDPTRAELARQAGAQVADSPVAVTRASDAVFLCLPSDDAVREVVFGADGCVVGGMRSKLLIDTSSIDPELTRVLSAELAREAAGHWVDSPVTGGVRGAADGTLVAFVGCAPDEFATARVWIACFAQRIVHLGPVGSGQWVKLCNQAIICGTIALWSEALALARAGDVDPVALVDALAGARADSAVREAWGAGLATGGFVPSHNRNLRKDIATVLARAREVGCELPLLAAAATLFDH
jgi:3-hydroxyisobutyrate dehydrogenase